MSLCGAQVDVVDLAGRLRKTVEVARERRLAERATHWWQVEDLGGWPPIWDYAINPPEQPRLDAPRRPWPSGWSRRPHP